LPTTSTVDLWQVITDEASDESSLWAEALRPEDERERTPVFSPLGQAQHALALETIYEGYLLHYGRPRLFEPRDRHTSLLLGDYLYAHGLVRIAAGGEVDPIADLAALISLCSQLRADDGSGDGEAWAATAALLGHGPLSETHDPGALKTAAAAAAGADSVEDALALHRLRVG
jgi:hypothetical protein